MPQGSLYHIIVPYLLQISAGLFTESPGLFSTWVWIMVVATLACPNSSCTVRMSFLDLSFNRVFRQEINKILGPVHVERERSGRTLFSSAHAR